MIDFTLSEYAEIGKRMNEQDFDHPFILNPDGTITDAPSDVYAPEAMDSGEYPLDVQTDSEWECAMYGASGESLYRGGVMQASEFIGAVIARRLLQDEPNTYVVVEVRDVDGDYPDGDPIGWTVLRKVA